MRSNLPVTTVEYPITDATLIVSRTDTKGKLTYSNDEFVLASGFTEAELMGQPHNIIRHPDMPPEAFAESLGYLEGRQAVGRRGEKPPQERRFLLGAGDRIPDPGERPGHRLYVDPHQTSCRSARGSRTCLRGCCARRRRMTTDRRRHYPPPLAVRPRRGLHPHPECTADHAGCYPGAFHADHRVAGSWQRAIATPG